MHETNGKNQGHGGKLHQQITINQWPSWNCFKIISTFLFLPSVLLAKKSQKEGIYHIELNT